MRIRHQIWEKKQAWALKFGKTTEAIGQGGHTLQFPLFPDLRKVFGNPIFSS